MAVGLFCVACGASNGAKKNDKLPPDPVGQSLTREDCEAIIAHVQGLAEQEAAADEAAVAECMEKITPAQKDCIMAATDVAGADTCLAPAETPPEEPIAPDETGETPEEG